MLFNFKYDIYQQYLSKLPKISISVNDIEFFYTTSNFRKKFLKKISTAKYRICIVALYLEQDMGGQTILNALYEAKRHHPKLKIYVLVDWHRAQRNRIGMLDFHANTNADWYFKIAQENPDIEIPIYGIPIHSNEALGVLHFKGFIIDNNIIYSGANLNNVYLHQLNKYRYDRYHLIKNKKIADVMFEWIERYLINSQVSDQLNDIKRYNKQFKIANNVRVYRQELRSAQYSYQGDTNTPQLSAIPLVGLGKSSLLNRTIFNLILSTNQKLVICTPYFNLPTILIRKIIYLLQQGKIVEIIVGDKTANDFFIPEDQPFKIIGTLPYLYEINLRRFLSRLRYYLKINQLIVRIWKNNNNSYHIKGIWVDDKWMLLTGNNLNPRAWRLDLENAILIYDPKEELYFNKEQELKHIYAHTYIIKNYLDLESISDYPSTIRSLIRRLRRIRIDYFIRYIT